jgi:heme peroxidase
MLDLKHGGHVLPDDAPGAHEAEEKLGFLLANLLPKAKPFESLGTPFDYLLPNLKTRPESRLPGAPAKVTADLKALGDAMVDDVPTQLNSTIPAVYTYWGQFIDHDMTANTDRDSKIGDVTDNPLTPVDPGVVTTKLRNLRRPTFDIDSVYGNGPGLAPNDFKPDAGPPDKGFYDGIRMRVGKNADIPGLPAAKIPPEADLKRDLPRIGELLKQGVITDKDIPESLKDSPTKATRAFIGDLRNDENLILAQFHLAFLRFHNKVVDALDKSPDLFSQLDDLLGDLLGGLGGGGDAKRFAKAQRLVRWHYQWLVVNDYLKTVTLPGIVDKILVGGNKFYKPLPPGTPGGRLFAPLEYSVAAFRFGHTMVRGGYDFNRNFGAENIQESFAKFSDLFRFTGDGHDIDSVDPTKSTPNPFRGAPTLPFNWIIEWDRMTKKFDPTEGHFARKIDTRLVPPIHNMPNEGNGEAIQDDTNPQNKVLRVLLRSLAQRNLLRGYKLSIPTGQAVADEMKVPKLSEAELKQGNSAAVNQALEAGEFLKNTPLWFYVLKEAEVRANGNSLGELGSRIVVETQIGLLRNDPNSYLNAKGGWNPSKGVKLANGDPIVTIRDFFAFADLAA